MSEPARGRPSAALRQPKLLSVLREGYGRTQILLSEQGTVNGSAIGFDVALAPRETWNLRIDVVPTPDGEAETAPHVVERHTAEHWGHDAAHPVR